MFALFPAVVAVENLDECVSINHNWINGHNAHWTWALLRRERRQAAEAIEDCRPLCRRVLFSVWVVCTAGWVGGEGGCWGPGGGRSHRGLPPAV